MSNRIWILGASDPEMEAIEALLTEAGETVAYATHNDARVHPRVAYMGTAAIPDEVTDVYLVECDVPTPEGVRRHVIDHHRQGDPGFGRPPAKFLSASSIGQVVSELARFDALPETWERDREFGEPSAPGDYYPVFEATWVSMMHLSARVPSAIVYAAAADHCLGAAYRGECWGVDPDALMRWRAGSRARFQGLDEAEILARTQVAMMAVCAAAIVELAPGLTARDMRRPAPIPELPEAATRLGEAYISGPLIDARDPDRAKYTVSGTEDVVRAWMDYWAPAHGITGIYGDPARGFAGGYLSIEAVG